jgi:hypothetical protein
MAPDSFPNAQVPSEADSAASSKKWVGELTSSSKKWLADAMKAWTEDDFAKVAVLAPLAVEHLGKAVLWKINPVLVVPLSQDSEQSLMGLATKPDLADPRLRTIGLSALLRRLDQVMGALPIDRKKCSRMVEVRNGAIHVGSPTSSRHVLLDSLALIKSLLENLDEDPKAFFGDHDWSVRKLLEQQRTEVGHKVAAKLARARLHLTDLEERLGETAFREVTDLLEEQAELLDPEDFGTNLYAIERPCPVCGSRGPLFGRVDAEAEPDWDVEPLGGGQYQVYAAGFEWKITLYPQVFTCNVCRLTLSGPEELGEAQISTAAEEVQADDLGEDFDPVLLDARHDFS